MQIGLKREKSLKEKKLCLVTRRIQIQVLTLFQLRLSSPFQQRAAAHSKKEAILTDVKVQISHENPISTGEALKVKITMEAMRKIDVLNTWCCNKSPYQEISSQHESKILSIIFYSDVQCQCAPNIMIWQIGQTNHQDALDAKICQN